MGEKNNVNGAEFLCPECGGQLTFNPNDSTIVCSYCGFKEDVVGDATNVEYDFENAELDEENWTDETIVYRCHSCDAENVVSKNDICNICPFCGSNQVIQTDEIPGIKPHSVVSFTIDKDKADDAYRRKIKKNIFVPRAVKKMNIQLTTSGVYLPVWSFDSNSFSVYSGMLGKTYTTTVGSGDKKRVVTRVRWYPIAGKHNLFFDDLLINSGKKITSTELKKLEPFDTNNAYLYEQKYLAGFVAEHYTVKLNSAWNSCQIRMKERIKSEILSRYIYDRIGYLHVNTNFEDIKYKYVLVPVWIGVFKYGKKNYRFLVNGTNEKRLYAKLPQSALKIFFFVLGIIAIVILLLFLLMLFMNE
jgi:DNA-directed RNA polymerase subunit RPC12/RpoP